MSRQTPTRRRWSRATAAGLLALAAFTSQAGAAAAKPAAPQLSIDIDDGHTTASAGDRLSYRITITNLGAADITNLQVTQMVPAAATFGSADARGTHRDGTITWRVKVKTAGKATLRSSMTVKSGTPEQLLRLATVTCAHAKPKDPPLVCASDSDLLPAGAAAQAAATRSGSGDLLTGMHLPWVAGGAGVITAALLAAVLVRRRST